MERSHPKTLTGTLSHLMIALLALTTIVVGSTIFAKLVGAQSSSYEFAGYAWSSDIGWISFSSINCDKNDDGVVDSTAPGCPAVGTALAKYRVNEDPVTGNLSGYAWSPNIGWITFDQSKLTGCPSGVCLANVSQSTGAASGWARACGAFALKNVCTGGIEPEAGGWDGWIHLLGSAASGARYGVSQGNNCKLSGFAYGSSVDVGWIHFGDASTGYSVYVSNSTNPQCSCPSGSTGTFPTCNTTVNTCPVGSAGTYPNCTCPLGMSGTYPACRWVDPAACPPDSSGTAPSCSCPMGATGTFPDCTFPATPTVCPVGYTGTYPACTPGTCPSGYVGVPPNCTVAVCPAGTTGTVPPNCLSTTLCPIGSSGTYPACACPSGASGTYPRCTFPPGVCPADSTGTPPNCSCPLGSTGVYPNCTFSTGGPTCPPGYSGTYPSCTITGVCPPGQVGTPPGCTATPTLTLDSDKYRVRSGDAITLTWTVLNVAPNTCTVTSTTGWSKIIANPSGGTGTVTPPALAGKTTFTLSCIGKDGKPYSKATPININIIEKEL